MEPNKTLRLEPRQRYLQETIEYGSIILNKVLEWHFSSGVLSKEYIMHQIINGPVYDESRYEIIERGLDFYLNNDFVIACHLWIPQIEAAICKLQQIDSHRVIRPQRNGKGYQMRLMDELLRDEELLKVIGEDVSFYLRVLLTEQRGLNFRNSLCHGIESPSRFDQNCASRLLHVLLMLANY